MSLPDSLSGLFLVAVITFFVITSSVHLLKTRFNKKPKERNVKGNVLPRTPGTFCVLDGTELGLSQQIIEMVTTLTLDEGSEVNIAASWLKQRVHEVLIANPWLAGRLCTLKSNQSPTLFVPLNASDDALNKSFSHEVTNNISECIKDVLQSSRSTSSSVNKDEPLWKVTMITSIKSRETAIVMSLNHVIGDGSTAYQIYGMLSQAEKVSRLDFGQLRLPFKHQEYIEPSFLTTFLAFAPLAPVILGRFLLFLFRGCKYQLVAQSKIISPAWLEYEKRMYEETRPKDDPAYISTNDILVSWLLSSAPSVTVNVNIRNRTEGVHGTTAGNFVTRLFFSEGDSFGTIRKRITDTASFKGRHSQLTSEAPAAKNSFIYTTNLCSFFRELQIPGSSHQFHTINIECLDTSFFGTIFMLLLGHRATMVFYRPSKDAVAVTSYSLCKNDFEIPFPGSFTYSL